VVYKQLVELHARFAERGLTILAFPCNQFKAQEPGTNAEILKFAAEHNVKFKIFSKIHVNGPKTHPLWTYLKAQHPGVHGKYIKWNFSKFLVDHEGNTVGRYDPHDVLPLAMEPTIKDLLDARHKQLDALDAPGYLRAAAKGPMTEALRALEAARPGDPYLFLSKYFAGLASQARLAEEKKAE